MRTGKAQLNAPAADCRDRWKSSSRHVALPGRAWVAQDLETRTRKRTHWESHAVQDHLADLQCDYHAGKPASMMQYLATLQF
jgi:hypothetical protein